MSIRMLCAFCARVTAGLVYKYDNPDVCNSCGCMLASKIDNKVSAAAKPADDVNELVIRCLRDRCIAYEKTNRDSKIQLDGIIEQYDLLEHKMHEVDRILKSVRGISLDEFLALHKDSGLEEKKEVDGTRFDKLEVD